MVTNLFGEKQALPQEKTTTKSVYQEWKQINHYRKAPHPSFQSCKLCVNYNDHTCAELGETSDPDCDVKPNYFCDKYSRKL